MKANPTITVTVRILVSGDRVSRWKLRLLGAFARALGVKLEVDAKLIAPAR